MNRKKQAFTLLITLWVTLVLLSGCNSPSQQGAAPPEAPSGQDTIQTTSYPLTYTDDTGVATTLEKEPQRIICLAPPSTEILSALGLDRKLIGLTVYDNYPVGIQENAEYIFEDSLNPNLEQLIQLKPDLVVTGMHKDSFINSLRSLGIPVAHLNPQSLESTYQTIEKLGYITNTQEQAQAVLQGMKAKEQAIADKVEAIKESERVRVWIEVDPGLFTAGAGTFLNELITKAGGINIASDVQDWAQYSEEQVIEKNPQVILSTYSYYMDNVKATIAARPAWQAIDAVSNDRIYDLDSDMVTRSGPRIVDGLETIAKALYPERF
ncbi:ABC transporter substrate-binding protein [Desulfitobacterium hafniense]|nr:ABC transporter substrate-binding protein [Desulfitobacterium hafniense]EHL06649.1 periplasmic binding protein [Desulfitobacterium hafniense DP7]MEA5023008.1 ABC transporter substrate-binding protein [Desulfitobacterium hafniense]